MDDTDQKPNCTTCPYYAAAQLKSAKGTCELDPPQWAGQQWAQPPVTARTVCSQHPEMAAWIMRRAALVTGDGRASYGSIG